MIRMGDVNGQAQEAKVVDMSDAAVILSPDMCERCEKHIAVTYVGEELVCGTCYVEATMVEPGAGTSALTGEPCC